VGATVAVMAAEMVEVREEGTVAARAAVAMVTAAVVRAGAAAKGVAAKEMAATAAVGTVGLYLDLEGSDDVHA